MVGSIVIPKTRFMEETLQNLINYKTMPYESGRRVSQDIARVGFLATVNLRFKGVLTSKHASKTTFTKSEMAPWCLADRVRLSLNNATTIWDTTGYGAYLQNILGRQSYVMDQVMTNSDVFAFGGTGSTVSPAGTDTPIAFNLTLRLAVNDRDALGVLLLQNDSAVLNVAVDNAPASVLMTDTDIDASISGIWEIGVEWFSVSQNPQAWPQLNIVHQTIEQQMPINSIGKNSLVLPRGNTYLRIINYLRVNGLLADAVDNLSLVFNLTNTPLFLSGGQIKVMHRQRYGRDLPKGTYALDFMFNGIPGMGLFRDIINSQLFSEFNEVLNISNDTVLGASNNLVSLVLEQLLEVAPVAV